MEDRISNRLTMIGAIIDVAETPAHRLVWDGEAPEEFGVELATLKAKYGAAKTLAARAGSATTGAAESKDVAETALENAAHTLARASALHLKRTGDLTRRAKVNYRLSAFQKLRDQNLVARCTEVLNIAQSVTAEPKATQRGVTAARITALTNALATYDGLINSPRGQIVNRTALLRDLETDTAELMELANDLDDLVVQFDTIEASRLFGKAWEQARIIVDSGHGPAPTPTPNPNPPPPSPSPSP